MLCVKYLAGDNIAPVVSPFTACFVLPPRNSNMSDTVKEFREQVSCDEKLR